MLAAGLVLGVAGCGSSDGESTATSATSAVVTASSTVSGSTTTVLPGADESTTTPTPTTSATVPTTSGPVADTSAPVTPTSALPAAAGTPDEAAQGLYAAWKNDDRTAALRFATQAVVNDLFSRTYSGPDEKFIGCEPDGDVFACTYLYEGGASTFRTTGNADSGYRVVEIAQIAD